jgi:tetratricopeptide (TPR) repeat protein
MDKASQLEREAIEAAISADWETAIKYNNEILKHDKKNADVYLRLGFAYMQNGKIDDARKNYKKALAMQPGNRTATDNLEKIKILESKKIHKSKDVNLNPYLFLDIPGKTKTVNLVNCGQKAVLARLAIGQKLSLLVKKRRVEVRTMDDEYIGCLPDDISKRLTIFIKAGSAFNAYAKETSLKQAAVFLKEDKKGKRVAKYISFPVNIQSNLQSMSSGKEDGDNEEDVELSEVDLEQLAESIVEEKEYLGYEPEEKDEEPEE